MSYKALQQVKLEKETTWKRNIILITEKIYID